MSDVAVSLPSGTITFLFTDIEGSTRHDDPQLRRDLIAGSQRFACCAQNVEVGDWVRLALPLATGADLTFYLGLAAAFAVLESDYPGALRHVDAVLAVARPMP